MKIQILSLVLGMTLLASCVQKDATPSSTPAINTSTNNSIIPDAVILRLDKPSSTTSYNAYFEVRVLNVSVNATDIKVFADNNCHDEVVFSFQEGSRSEWVFWGAIDTPGHYSFSAKQFDSFFNAWSNCSTQNVSFEVLPPIPPSSLSLVAPDVSPSSNARPWIKASGVTKDHAVELYSNPTCSYKIGEGIAAGTTVNIRTDALPLGITNIYAKSFNEGEYSSSCSGMLLSYERTN